MRPGTPPVIASYDIVRVTDPEGLAGVGDIDQSIYGNRQTDLLEHLAALISHPGYVSLCVVPENGVPVATGRVEFPENSIFAGIWGGATVPDRRYHGYDTALLA